MTRVIPIPTALASIVVLALVAVLPPSALSQAQLGSDDAVVTKLREVLSSPEGQPTGPVNLLPARPGQRAARFLGGAESSLARLLEGVSMAPAQGGGQEGEDQDIFGTPREEKTKKAQAGLVSLLKAAGLKYTVPKEGLYRIGLKDKDGGSSVTVACERSIGDKKVAYFITQVAPLPKGFEPPLQMLKRMMKLNSGQITLGDVSLDSSNLMYHSALWLRTADPEQITEQLGVAHFTSLAVRKELVPFIEEAVPSYREGKEPPGDKESASSSSSSSSSSAMTWRGKEITVVGSGSISAMVGNDRVEIQVDDHRLEITESGVSVDGKTRPTPNATKIAISTRGGAVCVVVDGQQIFP